MKTKSEDTVYIENKIYKAKKALKDSDIHLAVRFYNKALRYYKKLNPEQEPEIYPNLKKLHEEIEDFEEIAKLKGEISEKENIKQKDIEEDEISLAEIWEIIKKRKIFITASTLIILMLVLLFSFFSAPKLYESTSTISLGIDDKDIFSVLQSQVLVQSSAVIAPVIKEFFTEETDLETFKQKYLNIEIIQKRLDVTKNTLIPYIKITAKAETPEKAEQINEKIVENFLNYVKPDYEKETGFILKKIQAKDEEIKGLEIDAEKIKLTAEPGSQAELIVRDLIELRKRLSQAEIEKADIGIQLLKAQNKYEVISEPQITENLLGFEANSIISLESDKEDVNSVLIAQTLMESSFVLAPVVYEFFTDENITLEEFKQKHFKVELIETNEGVNPRVKTVLSYLKITTKSNSNLIALQTNQKILDNFLNLIKPVNEKANNLTREKINILNEEITNLKTEIGTSARKPYDLTYDESQKAVNIAKFVSASFDVNKRLSEAKIEKTELESGLNQRNKYEIISEPQLPSALPKGNISIWLKALIGLIAGLFISILIIVYYDSLEKHKKIFII